MATRVVTVVPPGTHLFLHFFEAIQNRLVGKNTILSFSSHLYLLDVPGLRLGVHARCEDPRLRRCRVSEYRVARVLHTRMRS